MDTLEFRQISKKRLRLFILVYTLVLLAILGIVLFGPDEIVLFMSSFRTGKFIAFLGGGILLSPLLVLNKLTSHTLTLSFDDKKMIIKGNAKKTIILFADIETMKLGKSRPNSLDIYDINQKLLYYFYPYDDPGITKKLVWIFSKNSVFQKTTEEITSTSGTYTATTYTRKH